MSRPIRPTRQAQYESEAFRALCDRFAMNLKAVRRSKAETQAEIAKLCEMSLQQYQKLEVGRTNVTFTTLARVSSGLEIPASELLAERVPGVPEKCYARSWSVDDTVNLALEAVREATRGSRAHEPSVGDSARASETRSPIGELVDALELSGAPAQPWLAAWSGRGADPVTAAWEANEHDAEAMLRLLLFMQEWAAWRRAVDATRWVEPSLSAAEFEARRCAAVRAAVGASGAPSRERLFEVCRRWRSG